MKSNISIAKRSKKPHSKNIPCRPFSNNSEDMLKILNYPKSYWNDLMSPKTGETSPNSFLLFEVNL